MPRECWCRECRAWVAMTDDGECPFGHGPESLTQLSDAETDAVVAIEDPVGRGPMPPRVERFNWGAFLVPALWGLVHGAWSLVGLWAIALLVPITLSALAGLWVSGTQSVSAQWLVFITVASDVVVAFIRLWAGANANRLYWAREAQRLESEPLARPRVGIARFMKRQRLWVLGGIVGALLGAAISAPSAWELWKPFGLQWAVIAEPSAFLAAGLLLGLWLGRQMRLDNPEPPVTAEEAR